jgi:uncharacterized protein YcbX
MVISQAEGGLDFKIILPVSRCIVRNGSAARPPKSPKICSNRGTRAIFRHKQDVLVRTEARSSEQTDRQTIDAADGIAEVREGHLGV